jgi:hypothetical protein
MHDDEVIVRAPTQGVTMGTSTLFPLKPASRVVPADTAWPTAVELHCGECGYGVTAR